MQDIHSMGAGRLFTGGGGGDRRLRPHQHQNHQVLKCPRCDSLNTKFCYYNNYNLSQPRHFCKSCRRYWTKGGVLRNVPVGGGCRKTKRSKPKPSSERERTKSNSHSHSRSHSSSESSSLTATTTAAVTPTTTTTTTTTTVEAVSAHSSNLLKMNNNNNNNNNNSNNSNDDSKYFEHVNPNKSTSFEHSLIEQGADCGIFSEIGSFTSLITSTNETLSFGFNNIMNHHHHHHHHQQQGLEQNQQWQQQQQKMVSMGSGGEELKMQEILDQTLQVELSALQNRSGNGGFGSLDWQGSGGDQGLFDLPNAVDQSYWSQSQWSDQDHPTLYLP